MDSSIGSALASFADLTVQNTMRVAGVESSDAGNQSFGAQLEASFRARAKQLGVTLPEATRWAGQALADLALHAVGVSVVSVRRASLGVVAADSALVLGGGDTLVISGLPEALALAESKLLGVR